MGPRSRPYKHDGPARRYARRGHGSRAASIPSAPGPTRSARMRDLTAPPVARRGAARVGCLGGQMSGARGSGMQASKVLMFDFDGVIADSWCAQKNAYVGALEAHGLHDFADLRHLPRPPRVELVRRPPAAGVPSEVVADIERAFGEAPMPELFPGIGEVVERLAAAYPVIVVSSSPPTMYGASSRPGGCAVSRGDRRRCGAQQGAEDQVGASSLRGVVRAVVRVRHGGRRRGGTGSGRRHHRRDLGLAW